MLPACRGFAPSNAHRATHTEQRALSNAHRATADSARQRDKWAKFSVSKQGIANRLLSGAKWTVCASPARRRIRD
jgi:hypothetical protein